MVPAAISAADLFFNITMMDYDELISFDALYDSMQKCRKGVTWKASVAHFVLNPLEECIKLSRDLENGTYKAKKPRRFTVYTPKRREIVSIAFRDRVYQRSLNDNAVYPAMVRSFVKANCACQKGKGTDYARNMFSNMLRRFFRKHGLDGYVLQCDIHGYYPTMSHALAERTFEKKIHGKTLEAARNVIRQQYDGDTGFNPGSQMIQIAGISVLNGMDHFIKEKLCCEYYVRYMDDFIILEQDLTRLQIIQTNIGMYLAGLGFEFNPKKTKIRRISEPINFLGFDYRLTKTGKVIKHLDPGNPKRERRRLVRQARCGAEIENCYQGWRAHAQKGNTYKLIKRMDNFYKEVSQNAQNRKTYTADQGPRRS